MIAADVSLYQDEELARKHIEAIRWPGGPACPYCHGNGSDSRKRLRGQSMGPGWYRCDRCQRKYTVRVGSIFERSHIPLRKWIHAAALMTASRRQVSVRQLRRVLGLSYHAAFSMARRIRGAMEPDMHVHAAVDLDTAEAVPSPSAGPASHQSAMPGVLAHTPQRE
jgi:transposase-like protein